MNHERTMVMTAGGEGNVSSYSLRPETTTECAEVPDVGGGAGSGRGCRQVSCMYVQCALRIKRVSPGKAVSVPENKPGRGQRRKGVSGRGGMMAGPKYREVKLSVVACFQRVCTAAHVGGITIRAPSIAVAWNFPRNSRRNAKQK